MLDVPFHLGEKSTPNKKFDIKLPKPPPLPPSVEEITKSKKSPSTSTRFSQPPPELPETSPPVAGFTPLPEPPSMQPSVQEAYEMPLSDDVSQLQQELQKTRSDLAAKSAELESIEASFNEIKDQLAQVGDLIKSRDGEIESLRSTNEALLGETKNKDNSLVRARAKIDLLEESSTKAKSEASDYQERYTKIEEEKASLEEEKGKLDESLGLMQQERDELQAKLESTVTDMEAQIDTLREEKLQISERLTEEQDEVKSLETKVAELLEENAQLKNDLEIMTAKPAKNAIEKNQIIKGRENLIALFNELLESAKHSVILVMPAIADLKDIDLTKLKSSVKALVSVKVDMTNQDDLDLVQELSKLSTVDLRSFNNDGRFGLNVDRGDVVIGVNSDEGPFGIYTQDRLAIDLFVKQFITDCWTGGRSLK